MTCRIENCESPILNQARQLCSLHYSRWHREGDANWKPLTPEDRFWKMVSKGPDCWEWTGAIGGRYGQFSNYGRLPAHRFSWVLHFGEIPEGLQICHHCDNPICVNPEHLFAGTQSDNMLDMVKKDRHPKQKESYRYKLTADSVRTIRASDETHAALARFYGVDPTSISNVRLYKTWRNLE